MIDIENAYRMVLQDLLIHGPNMFKGVYDAQNGNRIYMYGIQIVMGEIAFRSGYDVYERFNKMFDENMVRSQEDAGKE